MSFEEWYKQEQTKAFSCCESCGHQFSNAEVNIKRGWNAGYAEAKKESDEEIKMLQSNLKQAMKLAESWMNDYMGFV